MARKQSESKTSTALVVEDTTSRLALAREVSTAVAKFIRTATVFFKEADQLEKDALDLVTQARALTRPKTAEEDQAVQKLIVNSNAKAKAIEAHWSWLAAPLNKLHKWSTSRRGVGVGFAEDAAKIGNRWHNEFTEEQTRRAEEERQRLQRIEDDRARVARDMEVAALEAKALDEELSADTLSPREQVFAARFRIHGDQFRAAREAGYKNPEVSGAKLAHSEKITGYIEAQRRADAVRQQATALKQAPVKSTQVAVTPGVTRLAGHHSRTTKSAEVFDEKAFIEAALDGKIQVTRETLIGLLTINQANLNIQARDKGILINEWPGVRYVENKGLV